MNFKLGISTCPNDTFIFGALINGYVDSQHKFEPKLYDVQELNEFAMKGEFDIVKVSYGVLPLVKDKYCVLKSGGALGFGCGPLVVSNGTESLENLKGKKIAVPGFNTSAFRFFKMFFGEEYEFVHLRFDYIMPAILSGQVAAGVVIHEGRFVYESMGLKKICDLGEMWEKKFDAPIPLGAIIIKKELRKYADEINELIRKSINFSESKYELIEPYIKEHAQELDDDVISGHIKLYVNEYSKDISKFVKYLSEFTDVEQSDFI